MDELVLIYSRFVKDVFCCGTCLLAESRGACGFTLSVWLYMKECLSVVIVNDVQTGNDTWKRDSHVTLTSLPDIFKPFLYDNIM